MKIRIFCFISKNLLPICHQNFPYTLPLTNAVVNDKVMFLVRFPSFRGVAFENRNDRVFKYLDDFLAFYICINLFFKFKKLIIIQYKNKNEMGLETQNKDNFIDLGL